MIKCPKCKSKASTKYGFMQQKQRYKCKDCGCQYTRSTTRGKPLRLKRLAISMYLQGGGIRGIAKVLKVSNVSVLKWIRKFAKELPPPPEPPASISVMNIDEMWTFVQSKKKDSGSAILSMYQLEGCSEGLWVVVERRA